MYQHMQAPGLSVRSQVGLTLADGGDAVSVLVRDLDRELLCLSWSEFHGAGSAQKPRRASDRAGKRLTLDGHDHLDGVERVEAEVAGEGRGRGDLQGIIRPTVNLYARCSVFGACAGPSALRCSALGARQDLARQVGESSLTLVESTFSNDLRTSSMRALMVSADRLDAA